jgi:hypothetical protein
LDYSKPIESRRALESIRRHSHFPHKVIYLSNGGDQSYVMDFYREGLIDQLIFNKVNNGLGYGTEDLFRFCDTEWAIYWQNDQELLYPLTEMHINRMIAEFGRNPALGALGLAGMPCGENVYSERAHLINVPFYNSIPKTHGGCGPFNHLKYNEQAVQEFFKENGRSFVTLYPPLVRDLGFYTIRELPCGGVVRQRTDTKSVTWLKYPKEPYMFPEMNESEWADSIAGKWPDGTIPQAYLDKKESFNCWGDIEN